MAVGEKDKLLVLEADTEEVIVAVADIVALWVTLRVAVPERVNESDDVAVDVVDRVGEAVRVPVADSV